MKLKISSAMILDILTYLILEVLFIKTDKIRTYRATWVMVYELFCIHSIFLNVGYK